MGMFDTVTLKCPKCKHDNDFQFKVGPCCLNTYNNYEAPPSIVERLIDEVWECGECKSKLEIESLYPIRNIPFIINLKEQ